MPPQGDQRHPQRSASWTCGSYYFRGPQRRGGVPFGSAKKNHSKRGTPENSRTSMFRSPVPLHSTPKLKPVEPIHVQPNSPKKGHLYADLTISPKAGLRIGSPSKQPFSWFSLVIPPPKANVYLTPPPPSAFTSTFGAFGRAGKSAAVHSPQTQNSERPRSQTCSAQRREKPSESWQATWMMELALGFLNQSNKTQTHEARSLSNRTGHENKSRRTRIKGHHKTTKQTATPGQQFQQERLAGMCKLARLAYHQIKWMFSSVSGPNDLPLLPARIFAIRHGAQTHRHTDTQTRKHTASHTHTHNTHTHN